jgi:hypothetical protein
MDHRFPAKRKTAQAEGEPARLATGQHMGRQRIEALGNAVVPQVVACILRAIIATDTQGDTAGRTVDPLPTL